MVSLEVNREVGGGLFREVNRGTVEPPNCILSFVERLFCTECV